MKTRTISLLLALALAWIPTAMASQVVTTIKPLHSLVAGVLGSTSQTTLLITGNASAHNFQLKPSQVRALQNAEIIFYIDESFETFLIPFLKALPTYVPRLAVSKAAGLTILNRRESGTWRGHVHGSGRRKTDEKHHSHRDMHIWLDPWNARQITRFIAEKLSSVYPENRNIYQSNAQKIVEKISQLDKKIKIELDGLRDKPFIVLHDAYQYFEHRYNLAGAGSITFENQPPSPGRIWKIREKLQATGTLCVFREPQFSDRLINTVIEGTQLKIATLDPLGSDLQAGQNLYFDLIRKLAVNLKRCLNAD